MDELVGDVKLAVGKVSGGFIGEGNGSFNTPAKAEILSIGTSGKIYTQGAPYISRKFPELQSVTYLGQVNRNSVSLNEKVVALQVLDNLRLELFRHVLLDLFADFFESLSVEVG